LQLDLNIKEICPCQKLDVALQVKLHVTILNLNISHYEGISEKAVFMQLSNASNSGI